MSHDSVSANLFEFLWHDEAQQLEKSSISHFSEKISFSGNMGPIWPKITQPYCIFTALEVLGNLLA